MAGSFNFTREAIKELILIYEQYPEIYNAHLPEYKNRNIRQDRLIKITEELNNKYPGVTVQQVQLKLKNLRTQFFNELNKYKKSLLSGSGKDDLYKPSWWCFDHLMFLSAGNPIEQEESNLPHMDSQTPNEEEDVSDAGSQLVFDGTVDELAESEIILSQSEPRSKKPRIESSKPGTSRKASIDSDLDFGLLSPTMSSDLDLNSPTTSVTLKGKKNSCKNRASEDMTGALLKKATDAIRSMKNEEVDHFESFALNLAAEMRRMKNPKVVNALKRKFLNEVFDILEEYDD